MTDFQQVVNFERGFGVPGEILLAGPTRSLPGLLNSASAAYNIVGATAFTITAGASDIDPNIPVTVAAGGTGPFAGILVAPKTYASFGTQSGGPLAPTMTLPNAWNAEFLFMGEIVVTLPAACAVGDNVTYNLTTGALGTQTPTSTFTGVVATASGVAPAGATSRPSQLVTSCVAPLKCRSIEPPPRPEACGSTTVSIICAAIAASVAVPPACSTCWAAVRWC